MGIEDKHKVYDISIVMPCRNEEKAVGKCTAKARRVILSEHLSGEIIVVDNGSTDKSAEIAKKYGARVIHVRKPGYGRAIRAGLKAARGNVIIIADADTTYDLAEIPKIYRMLAGNKSIDADRKSSTSDKHTGIITGSSISDKSADTITENSATYKTADTITESSATYKTADTITESSASYKTANTITESSASYIIAETITENCTSDKPTETIAESNTSDKSNKSNMADRYDVVIGDRFAVSGGKIGIEPGAMPISHKLGVRFLSYIARKKYHTDVHDFHCGIRGITREALGKVTFHTTGMEFATEMIAVSEASGLRIGQVPVTLRKCKVRRRSKLRTVRDGLRHLRYILAR